MTPQEAAASISFTGGRLLADAGGGADGLRDRLAERGLVDEVVRDHRRGDLGLVDPIRSQKRRGLRAARLARGGRRGAVHNSGRRGEGCAQGGRQGNRVLSLEGHWLVYPFPLGSR